MSLLGAVTMPITRYEAGAWGADGEWADGPLETDLSITASVQPITPELMEDLPEGDRVSARFVMYAEAGQEQLLTVDIAGQRRPDRVLYRGKLYMVQSVGDWSAHTAGLPHQEYVLLLRGVDEP